MVSSAIPFQFPFHRDGPCDLENGKEYRRVNCFQFPFHRDGPCDFDSLYIKKVWLDFQFPFHRDGPCDWSCGGPSATTLISFQFPFHRDGPCDSFGSASICHEWLSFSSLFIGMGLAMLSIKFEEPGKQPFQFPFHRDGPCDSLSDSRDMGILELSVPFSSGWALRSGP